MVICRRQFVGSMSLLVDANMEAFSMMEVVFNSLNCF